MCFRTWMPPLWSRHIMSIDFQLRRGLGKSLNFFSLLGLDLVVCFGTLSCYITHVRLNWRSSWISARERSFWRRFSYLWIVIWDLNYKSNPVHYHHHAWLSAGCCVSEILFLLYATHNGVVCLESCCLKLLERLKCLSFNLRHFVSLRFYFNANEDIYRFTFIDLYVDWTNELLLI